MSSAMKLTDEHLTETALLLPANLPFEKWAAIGPAIARARQSMAWALGDWLLYGEANYPERYAQAIEATGYDPGTLQNWMGVCERIPPKLRRPELSFDHHRAVAYLPDLSDRVKMLDYAIKNKITRDELRDRVKRKTGRVIKGEKTAWVKCETCGKRREP